MRTVFVLVTLVLTALSGCADLDATMQPVTGDHAESHRDGHDHGEHAVNGTDHAGHDMDNGTAPHMGHSAGDHHAQTGMDRPAFPPAQGKVPTAEDAAKMPEISMLRFIGDVDLQSSGHVTGNGSITDPFVVTGFYVLGDLMLQDTDACVIIRENYIGGQLTLNWNAQCVHVHHNYIYDLRVNENIRRDGYATGGLLERNEIGIVGQLRHYDGEFRFNTVGPMPEGGPYDPVQETTPLLAPEVLIANIDGFNQGLIHGNVFHGSVDLDFHGHHHGTGFFSTHSHYHGDEDERKMKHDHTQRWTSVEFVNNKIIDDEGYGLRYDDRNHAGDDRTAKSEQEETLALDHMHRTQIVIRDNQIIGAGLWIDAFNADDAHHKERNDGWLTVQGNTVEVHERDAGMLGMFGPDFQPYVGFNVIVTKELELVMQDNQATYVALPESTLPSFANGPEPVAYRIQKISDALVVFTGNQADGFDVGLEGRQFTDVALDMADNDFGSAKEPTRFDNSVPKPGA